MNNLTLILGFVAALILGLVSGGPIIQKLKDFRFSQQLRNYGPTEHLKKKGTPTMGGIIFIFATVVSALIFQQLKWHNVILLSGMLLFGLIGYLDDATKIRQKDAEGLSPLQKIALNIVFSLVMAYVINPNLTAMPLNIPFFNVTLNLPAILFFLFVIVFYTAVTNSVNLSDGIDGLCGSVSFIVACFYIYVGVLQNNPIVATFAAILAGSLLAYLFFNWYPARVMMGDSGSFAIGGAFATLALLTGTEVLFLLIGLIYVFEALSVILQVGSAKVRNGKKIFKMAPIHHHFQRSGWSEIKIVAIFSMIALVSCILAALAL